MDVNQMYREYLAGNQDCFSDLYTELSKPVYVICFRVLQNAELAEDVMQDVFLRLYREKKENIRNLRAYVFQMAYHGAINHLRKSKWEVTVGKVPPIRSRSTCALEKRMDIEQALSMLSMEERMVFTLHVNGGMPFRNIAKVVGITSGTAFHRYKCAVKSLQKILEV